MPLTLTLDLEDHRRSPGQEERFATMTEQLLEFFAARHVRATVFVVGELARTHPDLLRRAADAGHELGLHGLRHVTLADVGPERLRAELTDGKAMLEEVAGVPVRGFRAPIFSLTPRTAWALDDVVAAGFDYSSSVLPPSTRCSAGPARRGSPSSGPTGSDATAERAHAAGAAVLRIPLNLGVGGALRCGFRWALRQGYDVAIQLDADGQHEPAEVRVLLKAMREHDADLVVGSRFPGGAGTYQVHGLRRFAMERLARRAEKVTGVRVRDSTPGFRAIRRPLLDQFAASYPVEYFGDTVEALIEAGRAGHRIVEQPVSMSPRTHGTSTAGTLASVWYVARVMIAIELMHNRRARPPRALPASPRGG